jgi:hypothetical protein
MKKKTPSFLKDEADEAFILTETTATLFKSLLPDFVNSTSATLFKSLLPDFVNSTSSGCFKVSNESPRFIATIKLETKKGAK